ncbi:MAG: pyruvate ferredoxin oxidoreductase [Candidatus Omnitrophica bacterium]|nr:pyruvate ferredoxin oxidoreductase [Candidatus Omnitrophota bacterium]
MTLQVLEGSKAVSEVVGLCKPNVISAYPITPQTHIVEYLAEMVADGRLKAEYINVESEHSAASACLGASLTGARTYTATTSQGLLLMLEVLYNISGLRLPVVLTCANRAISSPLNIWNDHQDAITLRDTGWIQFFAEDIQEVVDLHIQAYRIGEDRRIMLPVVVSMDGFLLTHTFEPVEIPKPEDIDRFLPKFNPEYYLTPKTPLTFGSFAEPDRYMETRYALNEILNRSKSVIIDTAKEFKKVFGRFSGDLIEEYNTKEADIILVGMGSIVSTMKEVADELRQKNERIGVLKIRTFRPFPDKEITNCLRDKKIIVVLEKAISLGYGSILANEIKSVLYAQGSTPRINSFIAGLGGRDISKDTIKKAIERSKKEKIELEFLDLNKDILPEELSV